MSMIESLGMALMRRMEKSARVAERLLDRRASGIATA